MMTKNNIKDTAVKTKAAVIAILKEEAYGLLIYLNCSYDKNTKKSCKKTERLNKEKSVKKRDEKSKEKKRH